MSPSLASPPYLDCGFRYPDNHPDNLCHMRTRVQSRDLRVFVHRQPKQN